MASEYLQDLAFRQLSHAIMATANSVSGSPTAGNNANSPPSEGAPPPPSLADNSNNSGNSPVGSGEGSIFDVVRRKLGRVQDVIQGITAPLKRRSMYEEVPEQVCWHAVPEHIEMSQLVQRGYSRGHVFVTCQLSNPTWCDHCGDFIWGLYKQCLRCDTCQYTCHQHCIPQVSLNCTSISDDGIEISPSALSGSSSSPGAGRPPLETSLSLDSRGVRPGVARSLNSSPALGGSASSTGISSGSPGVQDGRQEGRGRVTRSASDGLVVVPQLKPSPLPGRAVRPAAAVPEHSPIPASSASSSPHSQPPSHNTSSSSSSSSFPTPSSCSNLSTPTHQAPPSNQQSIAGPLLQSPASPPVSQGVQSSIPQRGGSPATCLQAQQTAQLQHHLQQQHQQHGGGDVGVSSQTLQADTRRPTETDAATEKDETDSGYRSGTIPDDKLPKVPSQATLDRQELKRKVAKFNHFVPATSLEVTGKESFQGFLKVTMNLIRPITMELGARPPSIYELLTREHIIEENTQQVAFYMPRDTHKSLHIDSETTTKEVVSSLLKKFHILDHPRKFAMYEQEFNDKNKLVRLRRLTDKDYPLLTLITWDPERMRNFRMVLQENETGEIVWDAFSLPELNNFLKVLDREEKEIILELRHKYAYMRQVMDKRLNELRNKRRLSSKSKA